MIGNVDVRIDTTSVLRTCKGIGQTIIGSIPSEELKSYIKEHCVYIDTRTFWDWMTDKEEINVFFVFRDIDCPELKNILDRRDGINVPSSNRKMWVHRNEFQFSSRSFSTFFIDVSYRNQATLHDALVIKTGKTVFYFDPRRNKIVYNQEGIKHVAGF